MHTTLRAVFFYRMRVRPVLVCRWKIAVKNWPINVVSIIYIVYLRIMRIVQTSRPETPSRERFRSAEWRRRDRWAIIMGRGRRGGRLREDYYNTAAECGTWKREEKKRACSAPLGSGKRLPSVWARREDVAQDGCPAATTRKDCIHTHTYV